MSTTEQRDLRRQAEDDHIEQAAIGCCMGPICEWPVLASALKRYGFTMPGWTPGLIVQDICKAILVRQKPRQR